MFNSSIRLLTGVALSLVMSLNVVSAQDTIKPDNKLESKEVLGRLVGYSHGDYAHVSIRTDQGSELSYFIDDEVCFLAQNSDVMLAIKYDEVKRFFPEGDGYYPANIIQSISTQLGKRHWIRKTSEKQSGSKLKECHSKLDTILIHHNRSE